MKRTAAACLVSLRYRIEPCPRKWIFKTTATLSLLRPNSGVSRERRRHGKAVRGRPKAGARVSAEALENAEIRGSRLHCEGQEDVHFYLKNDKPEEIVPLMWGPTGNLRAPLVRKGRTILVGFEEAMHRAVLEHVS